MNFFRFLIARLPTAFLGFQCLFGFLNPSEAEEQTISAKDLAGRLSALQDGTSYVRLRFEVKPAAGSGSVILQLQIKQRKTKNAAEFVYQVLWPKERKGEAVLLRKSGGSSPVGWLYFPPGKVTALTASQIDGSLFGSDLSYEDVVDNFFGWESQTIVGNEVLKGANCLILESKPNRDSGSTYTSVRSWIDSRRMVPLRVEKYSSGGRVTRRIETARVVNDDKGRPIPADLTVRGTRQDSVTNLDGSRIKHDVTYSDREFSTDGLGEISAPSSTAE